MGHQHLRFAGVLLAAGALLTPACGNKSGPSPTVNSVAISGTGALTTIGQTAQLSASATLSDGTVQDVTGKATWQSDNPAVVLVTPAGVITGVNFGSTTVKATYQSVTGQLTSTLLLNVSGTWKGTTA